MGFSTLVILVQIVLSVPVMLLFIAVVQIVQPGTVADTTVQSLATNGLFLSLALLVTTPPCVGLIFLFAWARRRQFPLRRYLGIGVPSAWRVAGWVGATVLFAGAATVFSWAVPDPVAETFMVKAYRTSVFPPLLMVVFILAAPLFEELLFRGFMFEGIRLSRLGAAGAVLISSAAWAVIHLQYGPISMLLLFFLGLLLGAARLRTGSVVVCFLMHAVFNLVGVVQVMLAVHA